jgi:methanogenic corrinoid protein MtbC1
MVETDRSLKSRKQGMVHSRLARQVKMLAESRTGAGRQSWTELLRTAIEAEILPALLTAHHQEAAPADPARPGVIGAAEVEAFVAVILADELDAARAIVDRVVVQSGGRQALLKDLLAPAARHLGRMWERDICDFMDVTLAVYWLDQFMHETGQHAGAVIRHCHHEHHALLLPAPGEQHMFGISMVADVFREAGWCVRGGPAVARQKLLRLVREEWFDVVGLSITTERWLGSAAACIRAIRDASCNADVLVILGGQAIVGHEERTRFLGADSIALDAYQALAVTNQLMAKLAEARALQPARLATLT